MLESGFRKRNATTEIQGLKEYYRCILLIGKSLCPVNAYHEKRDYRENDRVV